MEDFVWGKNADPTPAPPLQGLGVNSKGSQNVYRVPFNGKQASD